MAIIIKSNVKKYTDLNISEEFFRELEKKAEDLVNEATKRAKANGRRTVFARDL